LNFRVLLPSLLGERTLSLNPHTSVLFLKQDTTTMFHANKAIRASSTAAAAATALTSSQSHPTDSDTSPIVADSDDDMDESSNVSLNMVKSPNDMDSNHSIHKSNVAKERDDAGWWYVVGPRKQVQLRNACAPSGISSSGGASAAAANVAAPARSITNSFGTVQFLLSTRSDVQYIRCNSLQQARVYSLRGWQTSDEVAQNTIAKRSLTRVMGCDVRAHLLATDNLCTNYMADAKCTAHYDGKPSSGLTKTSYVLKLITELQSKKSEFLDANEIFLTQRICQEVQYDSSHTPANSTHLAIDPFMCYCTWLELRNFSLQNDNNSLPLRWVLHLNDVEFEISMLFYALYKAADYAYSVTPLTSFEDKQFNHFSGKSKQASAKSLEGGVQAGGFGQKARARSYTTGNESSAVALGLGIAQLRKSMLPPTPTHSQRMLSDLNKQHQPALSRAAAASASVPQQQVSFELPSSKNMRTLMCVARMDQRFQPLLQALESYLPQMCFQLCSVEFPVKQNHSYMTLVSSALPPCPLSGLLLSAYIHRIMDLAVKNARTSICPVFVDAEKDIAMLLLHQYGKVVANKHEESTIQNYGLASDLDDGGWNLTTQIVVPIVFEQHDAESAYCTLQLTYTMNGESDCAVTIEYQEAMNKEQKRTLGIDTLFPSDMLAEMLPAEVEIHMWVFAFQQMEGQFQTDKVHVTVRAVNIQEDMLYDKEVVKKSDMCSLCIELQSYLHRYTHLSWTCAASTTT
jgi:hypothetical protein